MTSGVPEAVPAPLVTPVRNPMISINEESEMMLSCKCFPYVSTKRRLFLSNDRWWPFSRQNYFLFALHYSLFNLNINFHRYAHLNTISSLTKYIGCKNNYLSPQIIEHKEVSRHIMTLKIVDTHSQKIVTQQTWPLQ